MFTPQVPCQRHPSFMPDILQLTLGRIFWMSSTPVERDEQHGHGIIQGATPRSTLRGWEAIEDYLKRHDDGMVKDLTDDIDTMLVFAGLFSAVLTAFLAQTYQLLQPDNSQLTVDLLSDISLQLRSFRISPPFINATLPDSTPAAPGVSSHAVAINIVWFLSLTFSLASALFGLLVKQWLREYMKWDNVLAPPRENVLIRQVRLEAWEKWRVSAIIHSIPALLEVAVVLFYAGMIVFLWTLQRVVAIVITTAIGFILALTVCSILLPVFFRHCPYKTPTGWALVSLYLSISKYIRHLPDAYFCASTSIFGSHSNVGREATPDSDSELDLHSNPRSDTKESPPYTLLQHWRESDLRLIGRNAISSPGLDWEFPSNALWVKKLDRNTAMLYDYEFRKLQDALSWVLSGSDSKYLRHNVFQCLHSVRRAEGHDLRVARVRHFHAISVLREHPVWDILKNLASFESYEVLKCPASETRGSGSYALKNVGFWHYINHSRYSLPRAETEGVRPQILLRFLLYELKFQFEAWELLLQDRRDFLKRLDETTERVVELTTLLVRAHAAFFYNRPLHRSFLRELTDGLVELYNRVAVYENAHRTGVVAMLLEILCMSGEVTLDDDGALTVKLVGADQSYDTTNLHATLRRVAPLAEYFFRKDGKANRHSFILLTYHCFCVLDLLGQGHPEPRSIAIRLLSMMQEASEISRVSERPQQNCGGWINLPWISIIVEILRGEVEIVSHEQRILLHSSIKKDLLKLLTILEKSLDEGLIQGETFRPDLDTCFDIVLSRMDVPPGLPRRLQWRIDAQDQVYSIDRAIRDIPSTLVIRGFVAPTRTIDPRAQSASAAVRDEATSDDDVDNTDTHIRAVASPDPGEDTTRTGDPARAIPVRASRLDLYNGDLATSENGNGRILL
ncbi:hypothetical protein NM688_g8480 [Phlebia brevispora]|uniref:Uncharacterized protein n=1 Tax=Phlebia brevispora TaxID=194682 RepID=A0ACC1RQZ0_9APHY|nr:hypothetical protein NM688_g8480 [Phlebia brevispora]